LKDGSVVEADLVIVGTGVRPNTEFLNGSGININKDGGL
jgi:apoptosis-inducing factor 3